MPAKLGFDFCFLLTHSIVPIRNLNKCSSSVLSIFIRKRKEKRCIRLRKSYMPGLLTAETDRFYGRSYILGKDRERQIYFLFGGEVMHNCPFCFSFSFFLLFRFGVRIDFCDTKQNKRLLQFYLCTQMAQNSPAQTTA